MSGERVNGWAVSGERVSGERLEVNGERLAVRGERGICHPERSEGSRVHPLIFSSLCVFKVLLTSPITAHPLTPFTVHPLTANR